MVKIHEVDAVTSLAAQVKALGKKLDVMTTSWISLVMMCEGCEGGHTLVDCLIAPG